LGILSALYGAGLRCNKLLYTKFRKPGKLPVRTVCIGNITTGGTGKTPAVIALAEEAKKRGLHPCILTRGYKGTEKSVCFVTKGGPPMLDPAQSGDEPYLMASLLRDVPIVMGRSRYEAGLFAMQSLDPKPDIFILDDGFQHWALKRDIDIVLIDSTNPFGNGRLLPEGILREPLTSLKRASFIILSKADMAKDESLNKLKETVSSINSDAVIYTASHVPSSLTDPQGRDMDIHSIKGQKVFAFAAIANPAYFHATIRSSGADIIGSENFRDHYTYRQQDIDEIQKSAAGTDILTTEKDMVKLSGLRLPDSIHALRVRFEIEEEYYDTLFRRIE
jgi:tetraacyldisaccharide 4'-kinase